MITVEPTAGTVGLDVEDLGVSYGGNAAVVGVSFHAPLGAITGLIGPNGAGKTTIFNACSGLLRPSHGRIRLFGEDISRAGPAARARRGLGRTFQRVDVCNGLSVQENVALARETRSAGSNPFRQIVGGRNARAANAAADEALARCGIADLALRDVAGLSTGQRRLVELARVLAAGYRFVLLDEPSSGLDERETARFGEIVTAIAAEGHGVLLVEHDMTLVMDICHRLSVLDFGHLIFDGSPSEVQSSAIVRAAYLGEDS